MALRDQPYLPLYVQDFLTDEKLIECSAQTTGVYIRLLCLMHKSDEYGKILLRQKDWQTDQQILNFAKKLLRQMPYTEEIIFNSLVELINEGVCIIDGDYLIQRRMVKDNEISCIRKITGSKGGFAKANNVAKNIANVIANTEYEYEDVNINNNGVKKIHPSSSDYLVFYDMEKVEQEMINSESWQVNILQLNPSLEKLRLLKEISIYCLEQKTDNDISKPFSEYKRHFRNWIRNKLSKELPAIKSHTPIGNVSPAPANIVKISKQMNK